MLDVSDYSVAKFAIIIFNLLHTDYRINTGLDVVIGQLLPYQASDCDLWHRYGFFWEFQETQQTLFGHRRRCGPIAVWTLLPIFAASSTDTGSVSMVCVLLSPTIRHPTS